MYRIRSPGSSSNATATRRFVDGQFVVTAPKLSGGQPLVHDLDDLAVGGRLLLQRPGRKQVQTGPQLRQITTYSWRTRRCRGRLAVTGR
jgi:hypothetical protein